MLLKRDEEKTHEHLELETGIYVLVLVTQVEPVTLHHRIDFG